MFLFSALNQSHGFGLFGNFGGSNSNDYTSPAIKLLESQLQIVTREQQQLASSLTRTGLQEAQAEASKLKFVQAIQSTIANTLANKALFDVRFD